MSTEYCVVCRSGHFSCALKGLLRCDNCGYVFADLELDQGDFEALYGVAYFNGDEYSNYILDKRAIQSNFKSRLSVLRQFLLPKKHKRLLEVGSAYGFFLQLAQKYFEEVIGIDVTEEGTKYATEELGLTAYKADLIDWDFSDYKPDVVCMWDTIEHLRSPDLYLEKISENMSPGGLVAITTGDIESLLARIRKSRWRMIHPPTHAHYFSERTLSLMLERLGFEVIHTEHCGFVRSLDNVVYNLAVLRWGIPKLYDFFQKTPFSNAMFYSNFFDISYVIARRRY